MLTSFDCRLLIVVDRWLLIVVEGWLLIVVDRGLLIVIVNKSPPPNQSSNCFFATVKPWQVTYCSRTPSWKMTRLFMLKKKICYSGFSKRWVGASLATSASINATTRDLCQRGPQHEPATHQGNLQRRTFLSLHKTHVVIATNPETRQSNADDYDGRSKSSRALRGKARHGN